MSADGRALHVEERGAGFPLLLIQGLGYAVWAWRHQLGPFSERLRTIAFDNRGAGRSFKPPGPYSIELLADDAAAVLDERGIERAHVLGFSMGGYVAQMLALRRPELVERLVLVGTSPGGPGSFPQPQATTDAWAAAAGLPPPEFARATMHLGFAPGWTDEHPDEYDSLLAARLEFPTPPESWAAQYEACLAFERDGVDVERIAVPALVIRGDRDRIVDPRNSELIASRVPHARLETLVGCGHLAPLEAPERFNTTVLAFLLS